MLLASLLVHNAVEPPGFVGVAIDGIVDFLGRVFAEMMRLAQHWPDAAHLEHQPLQDLEFEPVAVGQEFSGFRRQVEQDGARFEQRHGVAIGALRIDQRRYLVVGADGQELGLELVARANVDRKNLPVAAQAKTALLQHDVNLVAIGRGPGVDIYHGSFLGMDGCDFTGKGKNWLAATHRDAALPRY